MAFSACTNTIQGTINWAAAFILNRPPINVAGNVFQPALTSANLILSTILSPPFAWQWNRNTNSFVTVAGQSDYTVALNTFGWLEKATIDGSALTPPMNPPIQEIQIKTLLTSSGKQNRPTWISVVNDDDAGNITFRLMPIPDQIYTVELTYQNAAPVITSLYSASVGSITSIAPVGDGLTTIYNATGGISGYTDLVGTYVWVTGATSTANNGLFLVIASTATSMTLQNPNGVAQSGSGGIIQSATTWSPLPDKYNFLYERAMLAFLHAMYDSATYLQEMELFLRQLVGVSEGLDDTAKAIFLADRLDLIRTQAYLQNATTATQKKQQ
jgi:hypothetical protein